MNKISIIMGSQSDLVEVMLAASEDKLSRMNNLDWDKRACVCVVCTSGGYPGNYEKGKEISGLEEVAKIKDVVVFHAGTKKLAAKYVTNGGRVLGVTGLGNTIKDAIDKTYQAVQKINFAGMHYRKDIGARAI